VEVVDLGEGEFYDVHVPVWNNYLAHGFINHNSGKTYEGCLKGLWLSDVFPRNRGLIFRSVAKDLRATTMATFKKICPPSAYSAPDAGWNRMEGLTRLNNGSEILWLGLDNPELEDILKGLEINWFLGDQAEDTAEEIFDTLMGRLGRWDQAEVPQWLLDEEDAAGRPWRWRHPVSGKPTPPTYPMLTCNPDTELHWLYRRFHPESPEHYDRRLPDLDLTTGQPTGKLVSYHDLGYRLFHMPSLENKFLPAQNRAHLLAQDDAFRRRYVEGIWGLPEGAIHVVDKRSLITLEDQAQADAFLTLLRETCTLHRFLDHGDSAPTCCLWLAIDRQGNMFWFREYYVPNQLISYHRREITTLSQGERYTFNQADPSIFNKTMQKHGGRWSVADEYEDKRESPAETAIFWEPADNNELGTRNRINEYLRIDPERIHPYTKERGAPRMFFIVRTDAYPQGVMHALRETRAQRRQKLGTEMGRPVFSDERDENIADHGYDCLAGDTTVLTRDGWQPIASLVGTESDIWTLAGWQPYTDCRRYRSGSAMVRVETREGAFRCTPDHLILTSDGWKRADALTSRDTIAQCNQWSYLGPFNPSRDSGTTSAASIFSAMGSGFIAQCGSIITALCQLATMSITSMATGPIMGMATSCFSPNSRTSADTRNDQSMSAPLPQCRPLLSDGTAATPGSSGTANTLPTPSVRRGSATWSGNAASAAEHIWRLVAPRLEVTSAATLARAFGFGGSTQVTTVVLSEPADSYCLSVPAPHAFAIAGGFLVHNCLRYGTASRAPVARQPPPNADPRTFAGQSRLLKQASRQVRGAR